MGCRMSKGSGENAMPDIDLEANANYAVDLSAYEEACKVDPDIKDIDNFVQARTGQAIKAMANGIQVQSLSLHSLKEVTSCLLVLDQEVVRLVLQNKEDVWENRELFDLVEEYLDNSLKTLEFCTTFQDCLKKATDNQLIIQIALRHIPLGGPPPGEAQCKKVLEDLESFKNAEKPFREDFILRFQSVYKGRMEILEKLHAKQNKVDRKLKHVKTWNELDTKLKHVKAWKDLETIRVLVDCLEITISSILRSVEQGLKFKDALQFAIDDIRKKQQSFIAEIESLSEHVDSCSRDIRQARKLVVRIIKPALKEG